MKNTNNHNKHFSVKKKSPQIPIFPISVIIFLAVAIYVLGSTFTFKKPGGHENIADYGGINNVLSQKGDWIEGVKYAYFQNKLVKIPDKTFAYLPEQKVLSAVSGKNKWVEITLSEQRLRAYEEGIKIYEFPISSGLPWTPTITGDFNIWYKIRWTKMTGGSKEDGSFYDLPNVPYTMFFYKDYGMHGAYWHNNFGNPMSHGCVNMRPGDAELLFYWTDPPLPENKNALLSVSTGMKGTRVIVK